MNALAIDPGTTCGWAAFDDTDGQIESGVVSFKGDTPESDCYGGRFNRFAVWLVEMLGQHKPGLIVFEDQHFRGKAASVLGLGYQTRIMGVAHACQIRLMAVHSQTLKKWATGSGRATKDDMIRAAKAKLGSMGQGRIGNVFGNDEADAILLLCYAIEKDKEVADEVL